MKFLLFIRKVRGWLLAWDGDDTLTVAQLRQLQADWQEWGEDVCPEACAMAVRQVFPESLPL